MNKKWYQDHLNQIMVKADARYTPELHVDLDISTIFEGLSKNKAFYTSIREKYGEIISEFRSLGKFPDDKKIQSSYNRFENNLKELLLVLDDLKKYNILKINWSKIQRKAADSSTALRQLIELLEDEKDLKKNEKMEPRADGSHVFSHTEKYSYYLHHLRRINGNIYFFQKMAESPKGKLANNPFLLLTGSAGIGKTHLLCDLVTHRIKDGYGGVLLFSSYFDNKSNLWDQILKQLKLPNKNIDWLLGQLDAQGKKTSSRSIIVIDALNENTLHSPDFWKKNLNKLVKKIKKYNNLALIVSVRNGYEKDVITDNLSKSFITFEHHGFSSDVIWHAMSSFFKHYNVTFPEVPLLHAEFYNPLFLKFFCEKNKNSKPSLKGGNALKDVFEDFVLEVGTEVLKMISPSAKKRQNGKNLLWDGVVKDMALWMADNAKTRIPISELLPLVEKYFPSNGIKVITLMEHRVLLSRIDWDSETSYTFTYNKFSDHIIVRSLLSSIPSIKRKSSFRRNGKIGKFIESFRYDQGIVEALCIQVPEFFKKETQKELFELAPYILKNIGFESPFKESLIWRDPETIGAKVTSILERNIMKKSDFFLEPILALTSFPNHCLNAKFLDSQLRQFTMSERDSWWSTFLHNQHGERGAVDRLLQWSWSDENRGYISDESIFLTSITLAWFLTTPNRYVRDKATKGLVSILQDRLLILSNLLDHFEKVDDIYVMERLYAVAYGCVMRNKKDTKSLELIARKTYRKFFLKNTPPVHVLLRDYARGIVETALARKIKVPNKNLYPPFKSSWPKSIPDIEELKMKYRPDDYSRDRTKDSGLLSVWSSVMYDYGTMEDFGNYVVNSDLHHWSARMLSKPKPNRKKIYDNFKKHLTSKQRELLERATNIFFGIDLKKLIFEIRHASSDELQKATEETTGVERDEVSKRERNEYFELFKKSLNPKKRSYFKKEIGPYLDDRGSITDPLENFDTKSAQRWIFNRVIELGYDSKIHGEFDGRVNRYDNSGRSAHKAERIGKKYQWIAYHELMAMVSDHFELKNNYWSNSDDKYCGPWTPFMRDIDPSFIHQDDKQIKTTASFQNWRSSAGKYDAWKKFKSDTKWLNETDDLPDPTQMIEIKDDDGQDWLSLKSYLVWQQDIPPEYKKYDIPTRELFYILKSFIVKKKDYKKISKWITNKGYGNWLPESSSFYECFIGEYPNTFAFRKLRGNYNVWVKPDDKSIDVPLVVADDSYLNEFTLDCSREGSVSVMIPSKWIVNKMGLVQKYTDGRFYKGDNIVSYATSVFQESFPSALLIDKKRLTEFLSKNGYTMFWTLLGEKQFIGGRSSGSDRNYKGRLEIVGVYGLIGDRVVGSLVSKFDAPKKFKK